MFGKNNKKMRQVAAEDKKGSFSLKKLSIGLVSLAIGGVIAFNSSDMITFADEDDFEDVYEEEDGYDSDDEVEVDYDDDAYEVEYEVEEQEVEVEDDDQDIEVDDDQDEVEVEDDDEDDLDDDQDDDMDDDQDDDQDELDDDQDDDDDDQVKAPSQDAKSTDQRAVIDPKQAVEKEAAQPKHQVVEQSVNENTSVISIVPKDQVDAQGQNSEKVETSAQDAQSTKTPAVADQALATPSDASAGEAAQVDPLATDATGTETPALEAQLSETAPVEDSRNIFQKIVDFLTPDSVATETPADSNATEPTASDSTTVETQASQTPAQDPIAADAPAQDGQAQEAPVQQETDVLTNDLAAPAIQETTPHSEVVEQVVTNEEVSVADQTPLEQVAVQETTHAELTPAQDANAETPQDNQQTTAAEQATNEAKPAQAETLNRGQNSPAFQEEIAKEFHKLVNQERQAQGVGSLAYSSTGLQTAANTRTQEIISNFSHTRPNGQKFSTAEGFDQAATIRGENIQQTYAFEGATAAEIAQDLFTNWKNSPAHYDNIINKDFKNQSIGLEFVDNGSYIEIYSSQNFTN